MKQLAVLCYVAIVALLLTAPQALASGNQTCSGTLTRAHVGNLSVPPGGVCRLAGSTVGGSVTLLDNAYFEASGSQISGDILATGALTVFLRQGSRVAGSMKVINTPQVFIYGSTIGGSLLVSRSLAAGFGHLQVCDTRVAGNLGVQGVGPDVTIGNPDAGCGGNRVGGTLETAGTNTATDFEVRGNRVGRDIVVSEASGSASKSVRDNSGGGVLVCSQNGEPFRGDLNGRFARGAHGQCS